MRERGERKAGSAGIGLFIPVGRERTGSRGTCEEGILLLPNLLRYMMTYLLEVCLPQSPKSLNGVRGTVYLLVRSANTHVDVISASNGRNRVIRMVSRWFRFRWVA